MSDATTIQREMFAVIERHDLDALRALYHPDYTYMASDGVEQRGAEAGVAVAETYTTAFPDLSFETRAAYSPTDGLAILEVTARGTHTGPLEGIPATGKAVEIAGCNVIEVRDGKIYREREYFDTLPLMRQIGAIED